MRQFRVRDLMINLLPEGGQLQFCRQVTLLDCVFNTERVVGCAFTICPSVTRCVQVTLLAAPDCDAGTSCDACATKGTVTTGGCKPGTGGLVADCDACVTKGTVTTGGCGPGTGAFVADTGQYLQDLAILKAELKATLSQVEVQERAFGESLRPQTLDEVQQLEEKLTGALEELRARRTEIERATPKTAK
jgi:hypothetical protein